jgi:hypothetical protein
LIVQQPHPVSQRPEQKELDSQTRRERVGAAHVALGNRRVRTEDRRPARHRNSRASGRNNELEVDRHGILKSDIVGTAETPQREQAKYHNHRRDKHCRCYPPRAVKIIVVPHGVTGFAATGWAGPATSTDPVAGEAD